MKKYVATAVLVGLAAAAFAQTPAPAPTVTVGGYLNTGLYLAGTEKGQDIVGFWGSDAGKAGRLNLDVKYVNGNAGVTAQLRVEDWKGGSGSTANTPPYLKVGYAWAQFFDKLIYTQVGIINEQTARPAGDRAQSFTKEVSGAVLNVNPLAGLTFQIATLIPTKVDGADFTGSTTDLNTLTTVGGAAYTFPDTVKLQGQAKFAQIVEAGEDTKYGLTNAYVAASLLSVPNLKAIGEFEFGGLGLKAKKSYSIFTQTIDYGFKDLGNEPLRAGLVAYEFVYGADVGGTDAKLDLSYKVNPWASYAVDSGLTVKLGVSYFKGAEIVNATSQKVFYNSPLVNSATNIVAAGEDIATFEIKPQVNLTVAPNALVTIAYSYTTSVGGDDLTFLAGEGKSLQSLAVEYLYKF